MDWQQGKGRRRGREYMHIGGEGKRKEILDKTGEGGRDVGGKKGETKKCMGKERRW
jgi:hypothetical protein